MATKRIEKKRAKRFWREMDIVKVGMRHLRDMGPARRWVELCGPIYDAPHIIEGAIMQEKRGVRGSRKDKR